MPVEAGEGVVAPLVGLEAQLDEKHGQRDEAAEHFARAAEAEPRMKFRARLDPELTELVQ